VRAVVRRCGPPLRARLRAPVAGCGPARKAGPGLRARAAPSCGSWWSLRADLAHCSREVWAADRAMELPGFAHETAPHGQRAPAPPAALARARAPARGTPHRSLRARPLVPALRLRAHAPLGQLQRPPALPLP